MIYCSYPQAQYEKYKSEIDTAIQKVLSNGHYILGKEVEAFEEEFASWLGAKHAIGVNSGTDALFLAMKAYDICSGDEVIAPSFTALPTVSAVGMTGATPVLVDVDKDYYTIDPTAVEAAITSRTKAIIAVHLYGQVAHMEKIRQLAHQHKIVLIEDCAQAHGATFKEHKAGVLADISCFSFYPTKNLGALGDGGAIVVNDSQVATKLQQLRQYGWDENRIAHCQGYNSRLDEVQATVLRVKLSLMDSFSKRRTQLADVYDKSLSDLPIVLPSRRNDSNHAFHLYVIQVEQRSKLYEYLKDKGILAGIHYPQACHQMPKYAGKDAIKTDLHITEGLTERVISLPLYPELSDKDQRFIVDSLRSFYIN